MTSAAHMTSTASNMINNMTNTATNCRCWSCQRTAHTEEPGKVCVDETHGENDYTYNIRR
jgi:hypothetical protein